MRRIFQRVSHQTFSHISRMLWLLWPLVEQCLPLNWECAHTKSFVNAFCAPADSGFIRNLHFIISSVFVLKGSRFACTLQMFILLKNKHWNILILAWTLHELFVVLTGKGIVASEFLYFHMHWIGWRMYFSAINECVQYEHILGQFYIRHLDIVLCDLCSLTYDILTFLVLIALWIWWPLSSCGLMG